VCVLAIIGGGETFNSFPRGGETFIKFTQGWGKFIKVSPGVGKLLKVSPTMVKQSQSLTHHSQHHGGRLLSIIMIAYE
jgi:hypothetical protein